MQWKVITFNNKHIRLHSIFTHPFSKLFLKYNISLRYFKQAVGNMIKYYVYEGFSTEKSHGL